MRYIASLGLALILFFCPPGPAPAPGGISLGGKCGPTTVAPENVPHSEQGQKLD